MSEPGDRGRATQEYRGSGRRPEDSWLARVSRPPWTAPKILFHVLLAGVWLGVAYLKLFH